MMRFVEDFIRKEPSVEKVTRIGMDTSKRFFQIHGVDTSERVALAPPVDARPGAALLRETGPDFGGDGGVRGGASLGPRVDTGRPRGD
jgi:hypothetical protein